MEIVIQPIVEQDIEFINEIVARVWNDVMVVVHNEAYYLDKQSGLKALSAGRIVGCLHYRFNGPNCEILSLISLQENQGIGSSLLAEAEAIAIGQLCNKLTLITTNDNLHALGFYQRQGFRLAALYPGQVDESRKLKPGIPLVGEHNIPLRDEIKLEKTIR